MAPLLELRGLNVRYGAVEAVRGIDIVIERGEIVALLGANGAGKSSTMNTIVGLTPVAGGRVFFDQDDITNRPAELMPQLGLTLAPEGRRVFGTLSVEDNLAMGAYAASDRAAIRDAYERVFDLFPILAERRRQFAGTLSGGQQQMLAIGRALMCSPKLLLLDEPSLGLAPKIVEQVFSLLETLRARDVTLFVVEQNVAQALAIADRAYMMASGRIVDSGPAAAMRDERALEAVYLGHD
ncbi:MAG: ABC transporter ATP-binding protein [Pseudomonadota bacterium]